MIQQSTETDAKLAYSKIPGDEERGFPKSNCSARSGFCLSL